MPYKPITEIRYRENTGERFTADGKVRCQSLSKGKIRRYRESNDDWITPNDELFPLCQCAMPAVPGMFACHWHGGETPSANKPKSLFDVVPLDLGEKLKILMDHPDYISQREDINLLEARKWELLENVQQQVGGEEAWGMVADAVYLLGQGKLVEAQHELEDALKSHITKKEVWSEIRQLDKIVTMQKASEVKNAERLKLMSTADQVAGLINTIFNVINKAGEKYISLDYIQGYSERRAQADFINYVSGEIFKLANVAPMTLTALTEVESG